MPSRAYWGRTAPGQRGDRETLGLKGRTVHITSQLVKADAAYKVCSEQRQNVSQVLFCFVACAAGQGVHSKKMSPHRVCTAHCAVDAPRHLSMKLARVPDSSTVHATPPATQHNATYTSLWKDGEGFDINTSSNAAHPPVCSSTRQSAKSRKESEPAAQLGPASAPPEDAPATEVTEGWPVEAEDSGEMLPCP